MGRTPAAIQPVSSLVFGPDSLPPFQVYDDWQSNPTVTYMETTGLPLADIDFPSITICAQGSIYEGGWHCGLNINIELTVKCEFTSLNRLIG